MKILFIHQNYPGQFVHLAKALSMSRENTVVGLGEKKARPDYGYPVFTYDVPQAASPQTHHYIRDYEVHIRRGQQVFRACRELKSRGFVPDVIFAHPGWGEALFVKDVYPTARLLIYCEFYYRAVGSDMNFDPEYPSDVDNLLKVRIKNSTQLQSLAACDAALSPTMWQKTQYPAEYQHLIHHCHDGIDTDRVCADHGARLSLGEGKGTLTRADEVVTYVARNLEPYRGFHSFMRAIPHIQRARPQAHIVIIGGNDVSYGRKLPDNTTYREQLLAEVSIDQRRVHFMNKVPYAVYLSALRISSAHVYLTYPFVLSWSCLESMAAGCLLVASDTSPVREVVEDGKTGFLVDFFSPDRIAERVVDVLTHQEEYRHLRTTARETICSGYDLHRITLPRQLELLHGLAAKA